MNRILIVEDEPRIVSFLKKGLQANGFATGTATNAKEAISMVQTHQFDLMLLDLGLADEKDGFTVLEELRGQGEQIPIIILTARDEVGDKVQGFDLGANDYVTKPFRFEELLARVRVRIREYNSSSKQSSNQYEKILSFNNIVLDLSTRKAKVGSEEVELSAREFLLAETFFRHPGQVMSREQLLDRVWGYDYDPGSNIVDVYVGYLRKKLGSKLIETVRGMGYRLRTNSK